ncbi:hypothetical protein [Methylobacterium indicum]|uniref:Uncharacterized protein n=1 Tax=Methylobacterium indicum TaxID=1775910 RepID=A0A8H8WX53_9HYPH|nr:hypothetical protein [Methylobacterium indicum]BCM85852.1 hypothetical protein mvi_43130 [Methylobacterium indicum]
MRAFHRAGLFVAGLLGLAAAAGMAGAGRAVAQSDLEMPADAPVLSKPYRSTVPIFRRRLPPPDAVPDEGTRPAAGWREPPGRAAARDRAPPDAGKRDLDKRDDDKDETAPRGTAQGETGFGPVKPAPASDLAADDEVEERVPAGRGQSRLVPEPRRETRAAPRTPTAQAERPPETERDEDETPAYAGVWGPSAAACAKRRSARHGFLPAVIRPGSAQAGKTLCRFRETRRAGRTWTTTASCQAAGRRWTSRVRLTVVGNRLTWASERGSSSYTRCSGG